MSLSGSRGQSQGHLWYLHVKPCGEDTEYIFIQLLLIFTCKLFMIRGGSLLIFGYRVTGQGQIWHLIYVKSYGYTTHDYRLQFMSNHFPTSHVSCLWWKEEPCWFGSWVHRSRSTWLFCKWKIVATIQTTTWYILLSLFHHFIVHPSRRLKCTIVITRCPSSVHR